jgi:hypothetical protein
MNWSQVFEQALPYRAFLDKYATPEQRRRWDAMHARISLSEPQRAALAGFTRKMPVLVLNGAWCGDCINQCPIFDHFAQATPAIDLRFLDRDAREDVRSALMVNGGNRVPVVVWLSEDFHEVARFGDRTLAAYRKMAAEQLGPACPSGLVPPSDDFLEAVTSEWLGHFERAHLILRLSARLRDKHGD